MSRRNRTMTPEARALAEGLWPEPGAGLARTEEGILDRLAALQDLGAPAALPWVFPLVGHDSLVVRQMAAGLSAELLQRLPLHELAWLDGAMRERWYDKRWERASLTRCKGLEPADAVLGLLSMHPEGRTREKAVRRLAGREDGSEVPFLLLRRNDWVRAVRDRAADALTKRLTPETAAGWASSLALLVRLLQCGRAFHGAFVRSVLELLRRPECMPALLGALRGTDLAASRAACRLILEGDRPALIPALAIAADCRDPVVRLRLARAGLASAQQPEDVGTLVEWMSVDRFASVRACAIETRVRHFPHSSEQYLLDGLLDSAGTVRGTCQYFARTRLEMDVAAFYRKALDTAPPARFGLVLLGLVETGGPADLPVFARWVEDERSRVRFAAVRGLALHGNERQSESLWQRLGDPNGPVRRQAVTGLRRLIAPTDAGRLLRFLGDEGQQGNARCGALVLTRDLPRKDQVDCLLSLCIRVEGRLARQVHAELDRWLSRANQGQLLYTADEARKTLDLLSSARGRVPEAVAEALRFRVSTTTR